MSDRTLLADLTLDGQRIVFLKGGLGGRGNASYKTSTNRAPRQHQTGEAGEEMWIWLRLKLLADVGLVGLPNAGKSTFLNSVTNASAKVGDYPFTTLRPQLGVVRHKGREFVLADIPGLIEGAAEGAGVGDRFLGHVERTRLLLHLVDGSAEDSLGAWQVVRDELEEYGAGLAGKPEVIGLTKSDLLDEKQRAKLAKVLEKESGARVFPVSAPLEEGLEPLLDTIIELLGSAAQEVEETRGRETLVASMKLAITGGTGFVGSHLIDAAVTTGHEVVALARREQAPRERITWISGDLQNRAALEQLVDGADAVIHVAGVDQCAKRCGVRKGQCRRHADDACRSDRRRRAAVRPRLLPRRARAKAVALWRLETARRRTRP